jgi:putative aldouronate transport system substrate-binding protein
MKKIKLLSIILSVCMSTTIILSGCGKKAEETKATENSAAEKKPAELKLCISPMNFGNSTDQTYIDEVKKVIEEKTNTKLELTVPPHNTYPDKLNVLMMSGDIPDVFLVQSATTNIPSYAAKGSLLALDDLIKKNTTLSQYDTSLFSSLKSQGKIYGIPLARPQTQVILARKDILDANGAKVPTTTDEFYNEMKKLVSTGIVPLTFPKWVGNFQYFYDSFGAYYGFAQNESGKWYDGFNTQEMKDSLTYLAKLYKDGILDKEFSTNENAKMREKQWAGKAASSVYWTSYLMTYDLESKKQDPNASNIVIPMLKGPSGKGGAMNAGVTDAMAVSAKSKNPEAAVSVAAWLGGTMEGFVTQRNGVKGKHYTIGADGVAVTTPEAEKTGYKFDAGTILSTYAKGTPEFKFDAASQKAYEANLKAFDEVDKVTGPKYSVPSGKSDLYDKNQASYGKKLDELSTKVIMGSMDLNSMYKEYETFFKSITGDKILEELNK